MGQANAKVEDRYFIQKVKLGQGAFGTVWRAIDRQDQAVVAIKQMDKSQLLKRRIQREDVEREISVMNTCIHVNIIRLLNTFEDVMCFYLALEYCDGGDFGDKLKERSMECPEHEAASWVRDICAAIEALHAKFVCHRDVKPENFMVAGSTLKLADFGLSVFLPPGRLLNDKCGTPAFMAPELHLIPARSPGYGLPVDVWAAGVTMYMVMHGGRLPFVTASGHPDQRAIVEGRLEFPDESVFGMSALGFGSRFSGMARQLCRRMIEPRPEARISASEALQSPWLTGMYQTALTRSRTPLRRNSTPRRSLTPQRRPHEARMGRSPWDSTPQRPGGRDVTPQKQARTPGSDQASQRLPTPCRRLSCSPPQRNSSFFL
mmetsp:Transcript_88356/g.250372  ORF Transcript_88356/g.250372 Transcript_88356/m.250372 type:complete len:375 (+) Transcript_88356:96-1220(+)